MATAREKAGVGISVPYIAPPMGLPLAILCDRCEIRSMFFQIIELQSKLGRGIAAS